VPSCPGTTVLQTRLLAQGQVMLPPQPLETDAPHVLEPRSVHVWHFTQHVALLGLVLWLLLALGAELGPQGKLLPSPLYTAHVRRTVMVVLAGPLLSVFCSLSAVTLPVVVRGPGSVGLTVIGTSLLPPGGMVPMLQAMVWPVATHSGGPLTYTTPGGSTSTSVTLGAGAPPVLLTVTV
jgi:hypothetical protein